MSITLKRESSSITAWSIFLKEAKDELENFISQSGCSTVTRKDFHFLRTIGTGAFGRVYLAKQLSQANFYAIKVYLKEKLVKTRQVSTVINEKRILQCLNFPFTVYLVHAFHDCTYVYFCLPFVIGGEMFTHLKAKMHFTENLSKFYGGQVLLALEYLHFCDVLYRDLKPENILIDYRGYLKLTDFGFCKVVKSRTYTLCGTPEYIAPEIILNKPYGKPVDWWSYGVLLYEMNAGYPPFHSSEQIQLFQNVVFEKYKLPKYFSNDLKDIIKNLLKVNVTHRFGNLKNGVNDIKNHRWFRSIDWMALLNYKMDPEFVPTIKGDDDSSNFLKYEEVEFASGKIDYYVEEFKDF